MAESSGGCRQVGPEIKNYAYMKQKFPDAAAILFLMLIFWAGICYRITLPGIYMDAVNPDYIAARILFPALNNTVWVLPTIAFPILGNLYHGVQNLYVDIAVFKIFGISIETLRCAQALFGAGIVIFTYGIGVRATGNRIVSFAFSALLALDIAFISSFRTQFYIILGGEMWLFASLYVLLGNTKNGFFWSGVFYGLAIYGYFVLGFFAPAMAILVLSRPDARPVRWIAGFVMGMLTYVVGYGSLALRLGGVHEALEWIAGATRNLAPLSSKLSPIDSIQYTIQTAYYGLTNVGNEFMIFGTSQQSWWVKVKVAFFIIVALVALIRLRRSKAVLLLVLPVSYVAVAALLGNRLWVHHFSVLVPIFYLLCVAVFGELTRTSVSRAAIIAVCVLVAAGNIWQSSAFYRELEITGGTNRATSALSDLAADAVKHADTLYVFPDWGFFMSFALLTKNQIPYVIDLDQIRARKGASRHIEVAFWSKDDTEKYTNALAQNGAVNIHSASYPTRNGKEAFFTVTGDIQP
ncbi:glycosyl transferase family protein [Paraburkholderia caribensis MBA4]|uniref:Glycosyl transferase family protein n=1 Tax=Paraburkholderia caribensis MBA4 TaxID=1323664 RepID=A0A0P0R8P9_9BURK|nr:hypothetical protein [Paraburkholderia caribensis]ALL64352.1 glycosyl transferase family protein [Paraburkholderia caribensis MBA4]